MTSFLKVQERYYHTACEIFGVQPPEPKAPDHPVRHPGRRTSVAVHEHLHHQGIKWNDTRNENHHDTISGAENKHGNAAISYVDPGQTHVSVATENWSDHIRDTEKNRILVSEKQFVKNIHPKGDESEPLGAKAPITSEIQASKKSDKIGKVVAGQPRKNSRASKENDLDISPSNSAHSDQAESSNDTT